MFTVLHVICRLIWKDKDKTTILTFENQAFSLPNMRYKGLTPSEVWQQKRAFSLSLPLAKNICTELRCNAVHIPSLPTWMQEWPSCTYRHDRQKQGCFFQGLQDSLCQTSRSFHSVIVWTQLIHREHEECTSEHYQTHCTHWRATCFLCGIAPTLSASCRAWFCLRAH